MRVLLFYPYPNQVYLIHTFSLKLRDYGIHIDSICLKNGSFELSDDSRIPKILVFLLNRLKDNNGIRKAILLRLVLFVLYFIINRYDMFDFHSYTTSYNPFMMLCVKKKMKFDITLWGSDIMRVSKINLEGMFFGFDNCRFVKCSENLKLVFNEKTSNKYNSKTRIVYFGNAQYDIIDGIKKCDVDSFKNRFLCGCENKKVLVAGYNSLPAQNHITIISQISLLPKKLKDDLFVVFPLTYGGDEKYRKEVELEARKMGVPFLILDHFLEEKEIAVLRMISDLVVNIQDTDAFSASLQSHLYCNNILIVGEWLNYIPLDTAQVFYLKSQKEKLSEMIIDVLRNFEKYQSLCSDNKRKMAALTGWNVTASTWAQIYNEL